MEKKEVELDQPVIFSGLTIIPVVQTIMRAWPDHHPATFTGFKRPLYILVRSLNRPLQSFTCEGVSVSLEQILTEHPEIKAELENLLY